MLYFIVNEKSKTGKGVSVWKEVEKQVIASGMPYQVHKTMYPGHATELAKIICDSQEDDICLVSVGGDGTMNEIINGLTSFEKVRLGIIPNGSGNDFRRGLKLMKDPIKNWENIRKRIEMGSSEYTEIDLGQVTYPGCAKPRLFGISSGIGLDAIVCKKSFSSKRKSLLNKLKLGKLTYGVLTVQSLFTMSTSAGKIIFDTDAYQKEISTKGLIFAAAMNLKAEGGGVPMAPSGNPYDGLLSTCYVKNLPKWFTFLCFPFLMAAKHEKIHGFGVVNSRKVTVCLEQAMSLHADGEYLGDYKEATFEALPKKCRVLM